MITYVSGTLVAKTPTEAVIDVQGLGYAVLIPASSFDKLPALGRPAKLLTIHHVREDAALLFGFATDAERTLFREMTSVSGVGPKLALAALSAMAPAELRAAVIADDAALLTRIPGVGKKTAQRLCVELRDRLAKLEGLGQADLGGDAESAALREDARAALIALGLSRADAEKRIRKALRADAAIPSAEALIRAALRES
ncbi:MAG: Holliday junction branch migration protein RuvA [Bacteroidota bacterium]